LLFYCKNNTAHHWNNIVNGVKPSKGLMSFKACNEKKSVSFWL